MKQTLNAKIKQSNILIPAQQQSITVLSLQYDDLLDMIMQEVTENPLLEFDNIKASLDLSSKSVEYPSPSAQSELPRDSYTNISDEQSKSFYGYNSMDALKEQLYTNSSNNQIYLLANRLLELLTDKGFLPYTNSELSAYLGCDATLIKKAREILYSLSPNGVGFFDISEYLVHQLKAQSALTANLKKLCKVWLPLLAEKKYNDLAQKLSVTKSEILKYEKIIIALNPYPILLNDTAQAQYITPDIVVQNQNQAYYAFVNSDFSDSLTLSPLISQYMNCTDEKGKEYILQKLENAKQLINNIKRRNETLLAIGNEIAKRQYSFFDGGFCIALSESEVAQSIGVNVSTVSRAIAGKYLSCTRGIFPLKKFFSASVDKRGDKSKDDIIFAINKLVQAEDKKSPLSDSELLNSLTLQGFNISRRTVTKYRLLLNIKASSDRKERQ